MMDAIATHSHRDHDGVGHYDGCVCRIIHHPIVGVEQLHHELIVHLPHGVVGHADFWFTMTTYDGRRPMMEDDLLWKTTYDGRSPMMEDNLWCTTTYDGRQLMMQDD